MSKLAARVLMRVAGLVAVFPVTLPVSAFASTVGVKHDASNIIRFHSRRTWARDLRKVKAVEAMVLIRVAGLVSVFPVAKSISAHDSTVGVIHDASKYHLFPFKVHLGEGLEGGGGKAVIAVLARPWLCKITDDLSEDLGRLQHDYMQC